MMLPDAHCGAGRAAGLGKVHLPETDGGERTVVGRDPQIAGGRRDEPDDSRTGLPDAALPVGATFGDRAAGDVHRRHQPDARGAGAVSGDWPRLGMRSGSGILRRAARRLPGTECAAAARGTGRGAGENGREAGAAVGGRGVHAGDGAAGGIAGPAVREGFEFRSDRQGRKTTPSGPGGADPLVRAGRPRPAADTTTSASCGAPAGRRGRRPRTRGAAPPILEDQFFMGFRGPKAHSNRPQRTMVCPTLYFEGFSISAARLYTTLESTNSFICATVSVPMRYTTLSSLASAARTRQLVTLPP